MKRKNIGIFTGVLLSAFAALNLNAAAIKTGTSAPKMKPVLTVEYEYSRSGQIIGRKINGKKQSYKYDKKGQLLGVYDEKGNAVEEYVYDPAGNILKKTIHGRTTTYKYDKANQLVSSECNKKVTKYEYDAAGRLVKEGDKVYSYIGLDKIESVTEGGRKLSSFTYHIDGQLAARVSIESSETFHWDGLALIQRNSTSYVNEPAVTGGNPILADDKILFNDMLGTTLGVKDGDKVTQNSLTAFGESLSTSPMQDSFFTGKPHVGEMGYVFLFRAYRADQGKWQTSDPLGYPDGWNNLAYCNNEITDTIDWLGCVLIKKNRKKSGNIYVDSGEYTTTTHSFGSAGWICVVYNTKYYNYQNYTYDVYEQVSNSTWLDWISNGLTTYSVVAGATGSILTIKSIATGTFSVPSVAITIAAIDASAVLAQAAALATDWFSKNTVGYTETLVKEGEIEKVKLNYVYSVITHSANCVPPKIEE